MLFRGHRLSGKIANVSDDKPLWQRLILTGPSVDSEISIDEIVRTDDKRALDRNGGLVAILLDDGRWAGPLGEYLVGRLTPLP
jgi:hypothetical protein